MKTAATLLAFLFAVPVIAQAKPDLTDTINKQEDKLWASFSKGDTTALSTLLLPDYLHVEDTILGRDIVLQFLKQCTMQNVSLKDRQVRVLTPDSALIVYTTHEDFTCGGAMKIEQMNYATNAMSVWVRRDGTWMLQAHTEVPLASTPSK